MPILKKGSKGLNVQCLQLILNHILAIKLVIDGDFGTQTHNAVVRLQQKYKITVDGVVGSQTWATIERALSG